MIDASIFAKEISQATCSGVFGVPDSLLAELCRELESISSIPNVTACNEGSAVGLAIGAYLATGKPALVYLQNSGLGNTINPILSLTDQEVYGIPIVLIIGWRGKPGLPDEPQHIKQGQVTDKLLKAMGVPYYLVPKSNEEARSLVTKAFALAVERQGPVALLVEKGSFLKREMDVNQDLLVGQCLLTREEAMKLVHSFTKPEDKVVVTTGMLGREIEEFQNSLPISNVPGTLLVVGGMGHASSIALGMALAQPSNRVWCFDGDGSMLMHLGSIPVIANAGPKDLIHIVFDNGAHDSVGGQATPLKTADLAGICLASGYKEAAVASSPSEISFELGRLKSFTGPRILVVKVRPGSRYDLGRPKKLPKESKQILMNTYRHE